MIKELREYIKQRISEVDPDYSQVDDPIGDDDISKVNPECKYKIIFSTNSPEYTGNSYVDTIDASVQLFNRASICAVDAFDDLYDTSLRVKNCIISPMRAKNQDVFTDILITRMDIESLNTNDKTFRCTLNFTIRIDFTFN